jgi:formylglycine-generating enzyme required for sulfatase activity
MQLVGGQKKLLVSNDRLLDDEDELLRTLGEVSHVETGIGAERSLVSWAAEQRTAGQVALAEAKAAEEKVLAEARVRAEAEERERQRLAAEAKALEEKALAEAKAKVEAAETALASKLGLSKPFVAGLRGQAGDLAVRWIPSGRFTMGSPTSEPDRSSDEVQHEVVLTRGFFLAETECTQAQWEKVMGGNPSNFKGTERPVEQVSWNDAVEYCRKLTVKQRDEGLLPVGWEWRLPTEAEWEYGARAGTAGTRYGELDTIAWHGGNTGRETHPVSQKAANAWGLHDMIGNVYEWCADWSGGYPTESVTDPTGSSSGSLRVGRGGSWDDGARFARSASRIRGGPGGRYSGLGFRPALSSVQ